MERLYADASGYGGQGLNNFEHIKERISKMSVKEFASELLDMIHSCSYCPLRLTCVRKPHVDCRSKIEEWLNWEVKQ